MTELPVFPLTITRTGGVAGFQDVVVVAGDGLVSVERRGRQRWSCRLPPETLERLAAVAVRMPWGWISTDGSRPASPDDLVVTVASPAGGPVRLPDPELGAVGRDFHLLLADLNRGPGGSRMCTPV